MYDGKMRTIAVAAALIFAPALSAAYSNLIATADGATVYFQVLGFGSEGWFALRTRSAGPTVEPLNARLADVNAFGTVLASVAEEERHCGFAGSTCFTAANCLASFSIDGPGFRTGNTQWHTFVRLDRAGELAWIYQDERCSGITSPAAPPVLRGLYEASSLRQIAPAGSATPANRRYGRSVITDSGRALTFVGIQLAWLDATGSHAIRHVAGAFEAVTDQKGDNIVYVESAIGELHWIGVEDQDLGFIGSAPALTDDGRALVFLAPDRSLQVYDRATQGLRQLGAETYSSFTLTPDALFAVTSDNRLVRIDLLSGASSDLLPSFPELQSIDAPPAGPWCVLVCYGTPRLPLDMGLGMIVVLRGQNMDQTEWRARFKTQGSIGKEVANVEIKALSGEIAWFQVPSELTKTNDRIYEDLDIYKPGLPFSFGTQTAVVDNAIACFATLHEDFSRSVSDDDPASPGEVVHVFLTGLRGVEPVPDGEPNPVDHTVAVANPPALIDPGAAEVVSFTLVPGLIGIQRADIRVLRAPSRQQFSLFSNVSAFGCAPLAIAIP